MAATTPKLVCSWKKVNNMTTEAILTKYQRSRVLLSTEPVKQGLLADLRKQKKVNSILYSILFAVVTIVTFIAIWAVVTDLHAGQNIRTAILASAGIGVPASLVWMRSVIREWSQLNLLITLVSNSDEATIQSLIQKLLSSPSTGIASAAGV